MIKVELERFNKFKIIYAACIAVALAIVAMPTKAGEPFLLFSYKADRTLPTPLSGAKIDADFYISVPDPQGTKLTLSWNPNPDTVDGYTVYQGVDFTTPNKLVPNILHDPANFKVFPTLPPEENNKERVWVSYWESDLATNVQREVCFRLKAYVDSYSNGGGYAESGYSEAVCTTLTQVKNVAFYLDDPGLTKPPLSIDTTAPYDLMGTDTTENTAIKFNIADITAGQHVLVAVINFTQGATPRRLEAGFEIIKKPLPPTGVRVIQEVVW